MGKSFHLGIHRYTDGFQTNSMKGFDVNSLDLCEKLRRSSQNGKEE